MKRKQVSNTATAWESGRLAGIAWIQIDGMSYCTDDEVKDAAIDAHRTGDREQFIAGFIAGVDSMTVKL